VGISAATATAAGSMSAANFVKLRDLEADWDPALVRYYLVDYVGGSDANLGYVDAAAGATIGPGGKALKTVERLLQILPPIGNRRMLAILIANASAAGTAYLKQDGVTPDTLDTSHLVGYASTMVRGSTDLTNSAADKLALGAMQGQVGPGGGGVWTAAAGGTATTVTVASGALTAEPGLIGMRVRFTGNVTAGLANVTTNVQGNTGTIITFGNGITAPAAGDTFTIERPGVLMGAVKIEPGSPFGVSASASDLPLAVAGLAAVNDVVNAMLLSGGQNMSVSFVECTGTSNVAQLNVSNGRRIQISHQYIDEAGSTLQAGMGARVLGDYTFEIVDFLVLLAFAATKAAAISAQSRFQRVRTGTVLSLGSYLSVRANLLNCGIPSGSPSIVLLQVGGGLTPTNPPTRCIGGLGLINTSAQVSGVLFTGCSLGCVSVGSSSQISVGCTLAVDNCTGSSGNTGAGIDLNFAQNARAILGNSQANTVTGTLGDIRIGGAITTHASLSSTNVQDNNGNDAAGPIGRIVDQCRICSNQSGGALAVGTAVRGNGTTAQVTTATGNSATIGDSSVVGIMVTPPANAALGYMACAGYAFCLFDGAPTPGAIAYLSPGTPGKLTTTVPALAANNNRLRVGRVVSTSGNTGVVMLSPELLAVVATGAP